ncbi:MAG: ATP-binding cassette, subfamily bacterial [Gaiellaceae bacterium]|nr:ATP-binding cassette, subfamily bacterial [Gaiellaceae bacterium]
MTARRAVRLFTAYRGPVALVCGLIVITAVVGMAPAFLLRDLLDNVLTRGRDLDTTRLNWLVAGMVAVPIVTGIVGVWQTWLANRIGQQVMHDLRVAVYTHLQRLPLAFFTRTRTGEVQSRIANDIGGVQAVVTSTATSIAQNLTTVIATTAAMLVLNWQLTVASFVLLPFFALATRRVGDRRRRVAKDKQGTLADLSTLVEESLSVSGVLLAKTMGQGGELTDRFRNESRLLSDLEIRQRMTGRWVMASMQTAFAVMPALVYLIAGYGISSGFTSVSIGTLVAFTTLQTRLFFPVGSLLGVQADVQTSLALFERIFEYLDQPIEIAEPEHPVALPPARGEVVFDRVSFAYEDGQPTLADVSFVAEPGSKVAVVGETGSGKTTLGYLVARLYDPQSGTVQIDGVDVRDLLLADLASVVGVVSQETYLFHGTVRENLRFACPGATDAELEDAARAARIYDMLAGLPEGFDTVVGERGYRFSGGERQRLAIARTILRNPPVLVLDEATSSLDVETERQVQEALDVLAVGRTTIVIAHRLSTVRDADQIVVLDRGRIAERGTHLELLASGGRYAALVARDSAVPTG